MKKLIATTALLLIIPMIAGAQNQDHRHWGQGYAFIGEGADTSDSSPYGFLHLGGGAELRLIKGWAVGAEIGRMSYNPPTVGSWGVFSLDPSYHFLRRSPKSKAVPFVEAGYARNFRVVPGAFPPAANLFNFGVGFNYWAARRAAFRLEFRGYLLPGALGHTGSFWELRFGLGFR